MLHLYCMKKFVVIPFLLTPFLFSCGGTGGGGKSSYTITFDANGGYFDDPSVTKIVVEVKANEMPKLPEGTNNPVKDKYEDITYTFSGWSPKISKATKDMTYLAVYDQDKYKVTWDLDNGSDPVVETYDSGATPKYEHELPILKETISEERRKRGEEEYCHPFKCWDHEIKPVTSDVTYKATYDLSANYSIVAKIGFREGITAGTEVSFWYGDSPEAGDDVFINWGDGEYDNSEPSPSQHIQASHTYVKDVSGPFNICVYGSLKYVQAVYAHDKDGEEILVDLSLSNTMVVANSSGCARDTCIRSVNIPHSMKTINYCSFTECTNLESVIFSEPSQLETIGRYAFDYIIAESIQIPSSVQTIAEGAFNNCNKLSSVIFKDNSKLTNIGVNAFKGSGLESVIIPKSVTTVGESAFSTCASLSSVIFQEGINLETIPTYAFENLPTLSSVIIPKSVKTLGYGAFSGCGLTSVDFEENSELTTIGDYAFFNDSNITRITIPGSVTYIGFNAFQNNSNLEVCDLTEFMDPNNIPVAGTTPFNGCTKVQFYVANDEMKTAFTSATNWSSYADKFTTNPVPTL